MSLPYRAVSESTACPAVDAPGGGTTDGTDATGGGGWVSGAGRLGIAAGPEDGARLIAPPGASGTDAGGTGGGRSVNIWAETVAGKAETSRHKSANASAGRPRRPDPSMPLRLGVMMGHAFH